MVYCVGLVGGIGTGKSSAAAYFQKKGMEIIRADDITHQHLNLHHPDAQAILKHFGPSIQSPDGTIHRMQLRRIITQDHDQKKWLEHYLHPKIRQHIREKLKQTTSPYVILEIPLLTTREHYPEINTILRITAPEELQIERIIARDRCTQEEACAMIELQRPYQTIQAQLTDETICNDRDLQHLETQLDHLHQRYLAHSQFIQSDRKIDADPPQ